MSTITTVAVLGAGQMGAGIAQAVALGGYSVRLYDVAADPANRETMTFASPKTGGPVLRCYQIPKTQADLALRSDANADDLKQSLKHIGRASMRATHTVNQLLALARAESRKRRRRSSPRGGAFDFELIGRLKIVPTLAL